MQKRIGKLTRALVADGTVAATIIRIDDPAERVRKNQELMEESASMLAETMTICAYYASFLKNERSYVSISIRAKTILNATADGKLHITGRADGSESIKDGLFTLTRFDGGLPETGAAKISDGDIGSAFAEYYRVSEQRPIRISLGESYQKGTFLTAGGIFLEALPGSDKEVFQSLGDRLPQKEELCELLAEDNPLEKFCGGEKLFSRRILYQCRCNREKAEFAVKSMGKREALDLLKQNGYVEVRCSECGKRYVFNEDNIKEIFERDG